MILSLALLAVTLSVDALFAGFSYGLSGTRIPWVSKLIICAFSVFYAAISLLLGTALASVLPPIAGKIVGAAVLAGLGVYMVLKSLSQKNTRKSSDDRGKKAPDGEARTLCRIIIKSLGITIEILKNNPSAGDIDSSGVIDRKEALLLGFALSVDSLGAGIGSALSGLNAFYIPGVIGLCQLVFLSSGLFVGRLLCARKDSLPQKYGTFTSVLPGVLLVCLSALRLI